MHSDTGGAAIALKGVDVWAGSTPLLLGVEWSIMPKERWALLGPNGCGKSTLLRAIAAAHRGQPEADGVLRISPSVRLGMLEQTAVSGSSRSVQEEVMSRMHAYQAAKAKLDAATASCTTGTDAELESLEAAQAEFAAAGGYQVEARVARVLRGLGFDPAEFDRPCDSFSGGWQMRIGLARLLLSEPELLVLDEPTNHLDAAARRWLGDYVGNYDGTVLIVSHDEAFISAAADSIAEVAGGRLELYKSVPFAKFISERDERQAQLRSTVEAQRREAQRLQLFIDRMGAKASKASQAKDRQGKLDKLETRIAEAQALVVGDRRPPRLTLAQPPACGVKPIELRAADLKHPHGVQDIVKAVDLQVTRGMRLVLRGPNGAGKSTILKALAGGLQLSGGERITDDRLALGVFAQDLAQELPQDAVAFEYVAAAVREHEPGVSDERCRTVMGALGLSGEKATRRIAQLSGGEKARVALATFCLTPCNVLLLDEPTNHLDVDAIQALLDAMQEYPGALVVISHDRGFCEAMNCTHVCYVVNGGVTVEERSLRPADFSETDLGVRNAIAAAASAVEGTGGGSKEARALERQQRKELSAAPKKIDKVQRGIAEVEEELQQLDQKLLEVGADASLALELSAARDETQARVDSLYREWEQLEERVAELEELVGAVAA